MKVIKCDLCKKELKDNEAIERYTEDRIYDLCENCNEIYEKYETEVVEKRKEVRNKYEQELKEEISKIIKKYNIGGNNNEKEDI